MYVVMNCIRYPNDRKRYFFHWMYFFTKTIFTIDLNNTQKITACRAGINHIAGTNNHSAPTRKETKNF